MSEMTQTPADVRERVAKIVREAMEDAGRSERLNTFVQNSMWDYTDRILALLRAPHGEGEARTWGDTPFAAFVVWWQQRFGDVFINPRVWCYTKAEKAHLAAQRLKENGVPVVLAVAPAALRSESQGEEDAVRRTWELAVRRAYGCLDYRGGYRGAELEAFHAGIKTVIRALEAGPDAADTQAAALDRIGAALRSESQGDGPVGAVCANCGAPNAKIAGGELDPDEAVCSSECYDQLIELGCPQEHGGTYRPKPARRGEGGGDG